MAEKKIPKKVDNSKKPTSPAEKTDKKPAPSDKKEKVSDKPQKDDKSKEIKENKDKENKDKEKKDDNKTVAKKDSKSVDEKNNNKNDKTNKKKSKDDDEEEQQQSEVEAPKVEEIKQNNEKTPEEIENSKIPIFNVGDEVVLTKDRMGIVRFKGKVPEMGFGIFYGIELTDGSVGHNDGQVKGVRYFQTEQSRAMFVGHEKIRRKMTARDHKRIDSFHAVSKNKEDVVDPKSPHQPSQDDEKEPVVSAAEQERQRQESLAQRDEQSEAKEFVHVDGLEPAKRNENIIQFILRQNNKYRDLLLDTYANPQTHITIVHAFGALQEIEGDQQLQGWTELIKRWQKFL